MPSIQTASAPVTLFPERFASPFGNEDIVPLYSSVPLASHAVGCLPCAVCGTSEVRSEVITSSQIAGSTNAGLPGGNIGGFGNPGESGVGGGTGGGPIISPSVPPQAHVPTNRIPLGLPGTYQISEDQYRQYYKGGTWVSRLTYDLSEYYQNWHSVGQWNGSGVTLTSQSDSFVLTGITNTNSVTWTSTLFPIPIPFPTPPPSTPYHYSWNIQVTLGLAQQNTSLYAIQFTFPSGSSTGACIGARPGTGYPAKTFFAVDGLVIPTYGCKATGNLLSNSNDVKFQSFFTPL